MGVISPNDAVLRNGWPTASSACPTSLENTEPPAVAVAVAVEGCRTAAPVGISCLAIEETKTARNPRTPTTSFTTSPPLGASQHATRLLVRYGAEGRSRSKLKFVGDRTIGFPDTQQVADINRRAKDMKTAKRKFIEDEARCNVTLSLTLDFELTNGSQ